MWCRLSSNYPGEWKFMDLWNYSFKGYYQRAALAVGNKIAYFEIFNKGTFVLEEEEESEQLKVVREDEGVD